MSLLNDKEKFEYYTYNKDIRCKSYDDEDNELIWNVFIYDVNVENVIVVNLFKLNSYFTDCLMKLKENEHITFSEFSSAVESALLHEFWSRCEYETVLTSWPPRVLNDEVDRLVKTKKEYKKNNRKFICTDVNLDVRVKIDVYTQVMMNWNIFIRYLWNNRNLIGEQ